MGRPVIHWEFWSHDPGGVSDFYARVFDWKVQDMPELNYRMVETGEGGIGGGIMQPDKWARSRSSPTPRAACSGSGKRHERKTPPGEGGVRWFRMVVPSGLEPLTSTVSR